MELKIIDKNILQELEDMDNLENLNAEKAHDLAGKVISDKSKQQLNDVLKEISISVKNGNFECHYYKTLLNNVVKELENRKFRVRDLSSQKDGTYYNIKW